MIIVVKYIKWTQLRLSAFLRQEKKNVLKRVEMWLNICNWRRIIGKTNIISFFTHSWEHVEK